MNRLTGPLRSSSSIHENVRTSTLIHSGSSTHAKTMPRHVRESRVSAKATGKAMTSATTVTTTAMTNVLANTRA